MPWNWKVRIFVVFLCLFLISQLDSYLIFIIFMSTIMCLTIFIPGRPCRYNLWKHSGRYTTCSGVRLSSPYLWGTRDPPRPPVQSQLPVLLSAPVVPLHHCHDSCQFGHQTTDREWGNSWGSMHNSAVFKIFFNNFVNELRMFCRKYSKCKMLTVTIIKNCISKTPFDLCSRQFYLAIL